MSTTAVPLLERLHLDGWAVVELGPGMLERLAQPWLLVDALLGVSPVLLEVQPIHAVPGGRSFASSMVDTPLHTDSQHFRARPPELQLTACLRAADEHGESLLLDTRGWLAALEAEDRQLFGDLLRVRRHLPFVFGDVRGPTASLRGSRFVFTHTPRPRSDDPLAARLAESLARASLERVTLRAGEALLLDNHRVLHGRNAFDDPRRALLRVLAWLDLPLGPPPTWSPVAQQVADTIDAELRGCEPQLRRSFGLDDLPPLGIPARAVLALLSGAPPGVLAQRLGVPEPELYRWRDHALATLTRATP